MHLSRFFPSLPLILALGPAGVGSSPERVDFSRDVEPILKRSCHACHGDRVQSGGLRLDSRKAAWRGGASGRAPIVFGLRARRTSHPRLLDWLSDEFISQGWSMKAMHR